MLKLALMGLPACPTRVLDAEDRPGGLSYIYLLLLRCPWAPSDRSAPCPRSLPHLVIGGHLEKRRIRLAAVDIGQFGNRCPSARVGHLGHHRHLEFVRHPSLTHDLD